MRHSRNGLKMQKMTPDQQLEFMATADRVTVGTITQVFDRDLKQFYVAKVRGIIVSDDETYKFDTAEEARVFGRSILDGWKREYYGKALNQPGENNQPEKGGEA